MVPLSVLALDVDTTAANLADKLADQVLVDDLGRKAIDRSIAKKLIAEHHDREQARAQAAAAAAHQRREAAGTLSPLRRRVAALAAQQAANELTPTTTGLEVMCAAADNDRLSRLGNTRDEYARAEREGTFGTMTVFHRPRS